MKKNILLILMLIAAIVVMPRVNADNDITISDITNADTFVNNQKTNGEMSTNEDVTTITYSTGDFKILAGTSSGTGNENRPENKAWIGFRVTLPTSGVTNYSLKYLKTDEVLVSGSTVAETSKEIDVYAGFDDVMLRNAVVNATNIEYTYTLTVTLNGNDINKTIKIIIIPEKITLKDEDEDEKLWDNDEYKAEVEKIMTSIYSDLEEAINQTKGIDTSKYTTESVKVLEDTIKAAEAAIAGKDVTTNNQSEIKALKQAIIDAMESLEDKPTEIGDVSSISVANPETGDIITYAIITLLLLVGICTLSAKKISKKI